MGHVLSIVFDDNHTGHDALVVDLHGNRLRCDSYYFAIDRHVAPAARDGAKVRLVLRLLLQRWIATLTALPDGGLTYLPFDYSDEYTGAIECRRRGDDVDVRAGWTPVAGWSHAPSDIEPFEKRVAIFHPDEVWPTRSCSLAELVADIRASVPASA